MAGKDRIAVPLLGGAGGGLTYTPCVIWGSPHWKKRPMGYPHKVKYWRCEGKTHPRPLRGGEPQCGPFPPCVAFPRCDPFATQGRECSMYSSFFLSLRRLRETCFCVKYFLRIGYPVSGVSSVICFCPAPAAGSYPKALYAIIRRPGSSLYRRTRRNRAGAALCAPPGPVVFVAERAQLAQMADPAYRVGRPVAARTDRCRYLYPSMPSPHVSTDSKY